MNMQEEMKFLNLLIKENFKFGNIYITDSRVQTDNTICGHEKKNNHQVMNELKVLSQHMLDYNKKTFKKFMLDIEKEYRDRVNANKKMWCEIEKLKMQVQEAEKELASIKLDSTHLALKKYPI